MSSGRVTSWPQATHYNAAIQHPQDCFADAELRQGSAVGDPFLGLPRPYAGNFADVYQVVCPTGQSWAVKCFTREVPDLRQRYQAISEHLERQKRPFTVEFRYLEEGIRVRGEWAPILKMRWVEGFTLNEFVRQQAGNAGVLERMARMWVRLAEEMRDAGLAHGDLQHGNVLMVPGRKDNSLALRLIDYDGMFVPALAGNPPGEVGHPDYQHPQRLQSGGYDPGIDRFSLLVVYTALRALARDGPARWERYDNGDNLLFRKIDFSEPQKSKLMRELLQQPDEEVRILAARLVLAAQGPLEGVPFLPELVASGSVRPLSAAEQGMLRALLPDIEPPAAPAPDWVVGAPAVPVTVVKPQGQPRARVVTRIASGNPDPVPDVESLPAAIVLEPAEEVKPAAPAAVLPARTQNKTQVEVEGDTAPEAVPVKAPAASARVSRERGVKLADPAGQSIEKAKESALKAWLAIAVVGALLVVPPAGLIGWLVMPARKAPVDPPVGALRFLRLAPTKVVLRGGREHELRIEVERHDRVGQMRLRVQGLPDGVDVEGGETKFLAGEGTPVRVKLKAGVDAPDSSGEVRVTLWQGKKQLDAVGFNLTVRRFIKPRLPPLEGITLRAGERKRVVARVDRRGNTDPLVLRVEGRLPEGVKEHAQPAAAAPADEVSLELRAGEAATEGGFIKLVLLADGIEADSKTIHLDVEKANPEAVELKATPVLLVVKPGKRRTLAVRVKRTNAREAIQLRLRGLPAGVSARPVDLPADSSEGSVEVKVDSTAVPGAHRLQVVALVEGKEIARTALTLEIPMPARAVRPAPGKVEVMPARKAVDFQTVDMVRLRGWLYPSPKGGKVSPCILMLHEPGQHSDGEGWQGLARALQRAGCSVVTFDFRGHGRSRQVVSLPSFWKEQVNAKVLASVRLEMRKRARGGGRAPFVLDHTTFPNVYQPWFIQDLVAARLWLDEQHEKGALNTSNLIVVAAGESTALMTIWLRLEHSRFANYGKHLSAAPEGNDVVASVWLGQPGLTNHTVAFNRALDTLVRERTFPVCFVYGKDDRAVGGGTLTSTVRALERRRTFGDGKSQVVEKAIRNARVAGQQLLRSDLDTEKEVIDYVTTFLKKHKFKVWAARGLNRRAEYWRLAARRLLTARSRGSVFPHRAPLESFNVSFSNPLGGSPGTGKRKFGS
jgi:hypothetical protein